MGVEADAVDVEEGYQRGACVVGEFSKELRSDWRSHDYEGVWLQCVRLQ